MLKLFLRFLSGFRERVILLVLGVLVVSSAFVLLLSASETTVATVNEDLARYWRTTYDILVRPPGTRSPIETQYYLVQGNFLSNVPGGIVIEQYETIRAIPGVEVAAPIAMIGYSQHYLSYSTAVPPPGVYEKYKNVVVDTGAGSLSDSGHSYWWVYEADLETYDLDLEEGGRFWQTYGMNRENRRTPDLCWDFGYYIPFLVAGIDPPQEARLAGLDEAVVEGEYLSGDLPVLDFPPQPLPEGLEGLPGIKIYDWVGKLPIFQFPVLFNAHSYPRVNVEMEVRQLALEANEETLAQITAGGGRAYLETVPISATIFRQEVDSEALHALLLSDLKKEELDFEALYESLPSDLKEEVMEAQGVPQSWLLFPLASAVEYRESGSPIAVPGPILEAVPVGVRDVEEWHVLSPHMREVEFRTLPERPFAEVAPVVVGVFDIDRLKAIPSDLTAVPLETYYPPLVTLRYDADGRPVEPRTLYPTLNPAGYIQQPPLVLTTLEAARAINGDDCISAIRVRVEGIGQFSPEAQSRIEAVAAEIVRLTGLEVDVVVGSSPRRLLVYLPGLEDIPPTGYVEELWVQKGVSLTLSRRTERGNVMLFSALLLVCTLYIFNTTVASTLARVREFGVLKSLGWRSGALARLVLGQALLVGLLAGGAGLALAVGLARAFHLILPVTRAILVLPLSLALCLLGALYPAFWAACLSPARTIRQGEVRPTKGGFPHWMGYATRNMWRRKRRSILSLLTVAAAAGLLVLLIGSVVGARGYLRLTLLGEYILIRVQGYHYTMIVVALAVAAISIADTLLLGLLERRREIGVLKAVGWRTGAVGRLFVAEGALLGMLGGLLGTALGLGLFGVLYRAFSPGLVWIGLVGVGLPAVVGVLASLYPAWLAARVPPAEAVRYE